MPLPLFVEQAAFEFRQRGEKRIVKYFSLVIHAHGTTKRQYCSSFMKIGSQAKRISKCYIILE
jgi:hypothetical protein